MTTQFEVRYYRQSHVTGRWELETNSRHATEAGARAFVAEILQWPNVHTVSLYRIEQLDLGAPAPADPETTEAP